jgi:transposase-like protein
MAIIYLTNQDYCRILINMKAPKTLQDAIIHFADVDNCVKYLADRRWPNGVECPTCGRKDARWLANQHKWQCKTVHPKRQFSVKVGTIFEDSPLGLEKWLPAVWMIASAKNGVSSYEISRSLGVTQKTAWFMLHRIREAMQNGSMLKMGGNDGGPVEVDETFVGPKPQKMHRDRRLRMQTAQKGNQKSIVMGMLDRECRQVRAMVVPNVETRNSSSKDSQRDRTRRYRLH